jgi:chloramphenicol 3-O-phosphotransferase
MRPCALILDGPTQVGRSTTIDALQTRWAGIYAAPLLRVGFDTIEAAFGPDHQRWRELVLPRTSPVAGVGAHYGPLGRELTAGMHRAAKAWLDAGFDVVLEHTFLDRQCPDDLADVLRHDVTIMIGLTCDDDILAARERAADRNVGRARAEQAAGRDVTTRDLVLDTSEATTDELVDDIMALVTRRRIGT